MRAVFVIGTFEPDGVRLGQPIMPRTERLLRHLAEGLDVEIVFVIQDEILAGKDKHKIGIKAIRKERPRVLSEIGAFSPDFVMCFGPVAAACVFGHGNMSEDNLIRVRHDIFEAGPPVYYTYSLENVRRAAGLVQWLEMDVKAAVEGRSETEWGEYEVLTPDMPQWKTAQLANEDTIPLDKVVALDAETYPGLRYYDPEARLRMVQISQKPGQALVVQATADSRLPQPVIELLESPTIKKIGSNIKYDYKWLRRFGIQMRNFEDTSTREHIIDQSNPKKDLKSLTFKYRPRLGDYSRAHRELVKERGGWENLEDHEFYQYAGADAEASIAAYYGQEYELAALERPRKLFQELYAVLAELEFSGIRVDTTENRRLDTVYKAKLREMAAKVRETLGPINLNSTPQLARALKEAVPSIDLKLRDWRALIGNDEDMEISTCREILERESHKHPIIKDVLQYRKYRTRHSTFIKSVYDNHLVEHHGHHFLHPSYRTDLVETYRLSSQNPNMQNMPVRDFQEPDLSIKRQFVSRFPGGKILEVDQSQIEIRFAAWASGDKAMIDAVLSGQDIHTMMASILLGKPPESITEQERYECKTRTFLIMYGGGANKLVEQLLKSDVAPRRVSKKQAIDMIQDYFLTFAGLKRYIDQTRALVRRDLSIETAFGFRRQFVEPDFWRSANGFRIERQAFNTCIQNGAACLTYCAMIEMQNAIESSNLQSRMVGQVHDSVVFDVHPYELTVMKEIARHGMELAVIEKAKEFGVDFTIPLKADIKIGDSWGTLMTV